MLLQFQKLRKWKKRFGMAARHINIVNLQSRGGKCENPIVFV
jgi:hypothetical protein